MKQTIFRIIFFVLSVALVTLFLPHNDGFRYEFEVGKPWRYGLLTAPYDIPIYRSDSTIQAMQDSVGRNLIPKYILDAEIGTQQLAQVASAHTTRRRLNDTEYRYLRTALDGVYQAGILPIVDKNQLQQQQLRQIWIQTAANRGRSMDLEDVLTVREAYEQIMNGTQEAGISVQALKSFDVNRYLVANLELDTAATQKEYYDLMQGISQTSGVVQAETRIIDRGEIVTPETYNILNSYRKAQQKRRAFGGDEVMMIVGQIFLVAMFLGAILLFLNRFRPWIYHSMHETWVGMALIVLMVILTSITSNLFVQGAYLVPIGIVTIVLSTFHGARTAYFSHIVMSLLCSFMASAPFEYIVVQLAVGMVIVFSLKDGLTERSQLMRVAIFALLTYSLVYTAFTLVSEGTFSNLSWFTYVLFLINSLLLLLTYLIIFGLEKLFGFMSGVTLVELCNLNKGLLLRLSEECQGTFQHSMQVSNLTAYAAKRIGANAQLVRTGALYHDIGKLWNPSYYTENQHGVNPHDALTTEQSVEYIRRHVTEGVRLAERAKLPREIVEFIVTHHGCGVMKYFYNTWCNAHPNEVPDVRDFSYPGPDPTTREQALLMMGDAVEAASKSMKDYSEESLAKLVNTIIDGMVSDGRLRLTKLSFRDVEEVKRAFVEYLQSVYHTRIAYPELKRSMAANQLKH
jgi:putative nucleotidyltransferase with HDIG domain